MRELAPQTVGRKTGLALEGRDAAKALVKRSRHKYVFKLPKMTAPPTRSRPGIGFSEVVDDYFRAFKGCQP